MYTIVQKFGLNEIFEIFLKEVFSAYKGCIYFTKNTVQFLNITI